MSGRYATGATPDRPEFEVRVAGVTLEPIVQRDVVEIDVSEEVNRHGRLTLLVQNWDPDTRTVRHSDDGPFAPGAELEVLVGYHSDLESVFDGVVTAITTHFPSDRPPVLRVEARSKSILLDHPPRSRVFEETTDGDVATAIASDHGLQTDTETGAGLPFVVSERRTDWQHLIERGTGLGWVTYVRGDTLVFRPPASSSDPIELQYGLNLTELQITQDLTRLSDPVTRVEWDAAALEALEAEAGPSQADVEVGDRSDHGTALGDAGWPLRSEVDSSSVVGTPEEADLLAAGHARNIALRHFSGTGSMVGTPTLRCDGWITVSDVGERMAGPHYVSAVRHRLSSRGYVTEFQMGMPARLGPVVDEPPSGGIRIGVVEELADPEGWGRVKVAFPWRTDAPAAVWARVATLDAGPEQGTFFLPDPGQEVVVGLLDDQAAQPVVLGSLWNGVQAPPIEVDADQNHVRAIVTRSGHRLVFDDSDEAFVTIETAGGNTVKLSDADGAITVKESESGNGITVSADGIEIKATKGDIVLSASAGKVKLDAAGIEGKATGPAKLESSATLDLKASATLGIRGSLVNIN